MKYSYFIRKNIDYIKGNDYIIYPNGKQIYKKKNDCEVLITDYTGEKLSFNVDVVTIDIWIKDSFTDVVFFNKYHIYPWWKSRHPKMEKIDKKINKIINNYEKNRKS